MAKTYNRLELDVNKKPNSIGIRPVQNDTKSRYLDVCLYENGVPINLTGEPGAYHIQKGGRQHIFQPRGSDGCDCGQMPICLDE